MYGALFLCVTWVQLFITTAPVQGRGAVFSISQKSPKPFLKSGPRVLVNLYRKYNAEAPTEVRDAALANDRSVSALPEDFDAEYLCPVKIGGQTLNLNFDTGSSDLWVFSSALDANDHEGHSIYDPSLSPTSKPLGGETWGITYGDGSGAIGNVYIDNVEVGNTIASNQAVEAATNITYEFEADTNNDGLLGLAFDKINMVKPTKQKTFFSNVRGSLAAPLFTADLKMGSPGSYDFGFVDSEKYTDALTYVPVNDSGGFWNFRSNGFAIGKGSFSTASIDSIMDTGTTLLLLPASIVGAYYAKVRRARYDRAQGGFVFPCSVTLPDLRLGFGTYKATVPGSFIKYAPVDHGGLICFGGIQRNTGIGFSIFGDVFIKSQFVVFDSMGPRIGIAPKTL